MRTIILAAGKNTRLDTGKPKSLIELNGMTLLERHVRNFSPVGCRHFCVVTGYNPQPIRDIVPFIAEKYQVEINLVHNERFDLENGFSISVTEEWVKSSKSEGFFLTMGDHVFQKEFVRSFIDVITNNPTTQKLHLAVDPPGKLNKHIDLEDVTKVMADDQDFIEQIGKEITEYNLYDTGLFYMKSAVFETLNACFSKKLYAISNMVSELIRTKEAKVVRLPGYVWNDVDNPDDLAQTIRLGLD